MKVAILSGVHANLEALACFPDGNDERWVLGDLAMYAPNPDRRVI